LFAERGVGIKPEQELTVFELWQWCIPKELNAGITLGKFIKRIKLAYSKTTFGGILPRGSVEVLPDFEQDDAVEIDGSGLISREALNKVWIAYRRVEIAQKTSPDQDSDLSNETCPWTGFQGRLGGFKGMWLLDEALGEGIKVQCRTSQHKYNLPQKCIVSAEDEAVVGRYDAMYDTFEVCSWDKKPVQGTVNTRLIQMLSEAGVDEEFFMKHVDESTEWLNCLSEDPGRLVEHLKYRAAVMADEPKEATNLENTDSSFVFKLALSRVDPTEPILAERCERLVRKEFQKMRSKVRL
jgi:hypothetical protein